MLWLLDVGWAQATEAETAAMVGWLRTARNPQRQRCRADGFPTGAVNPKTGKRTPTAGYSPATIAHALTVVHGFYDFHIHFGRGPVLNPVPDSSARRAALAHRSPIEAPARFRRGRLRPKVPARQTAPSPISSGTSCSAGCGANGDRALLSCYVDSGARASELLGLLLPDIDWQKGQLWVISKGTRERQPVPVSPSGLAHLAAYLEEAGLPKDGQTVWRTCRGEVRPLTYWAARRILQRATEHLGMNWTLHDLRHTAATRMARDPAMTLAEVQTILRHAHITTTHLYTVVALDDLVDKLAEHYSRLQQPTTWSQQYDAEDIAVVFGAR
ncbi:site-specific integrase [Streptomyces sp. NPDC006368]|uniref:tyrosine-type recombinase/integrase n=1 Tax=Streptomyces sp. NPDC006368 TaxID=3156760 RepID=UPI0033BB1030